MPFFAQPDGHSGGNFNSSAQCLCRRSLLDCDFPVETDMAGDVPMYPDDSHTGLVHSSVQQAPL